MPHVSKKKIGKDALLRIQDRFIDSVSTLDSKKKRLSYLGEILTQTERLMIAKRVSIIIMLHEGISTYKIFKSLGVSTSTIKRYKKSLESGEYSYIQSLLRKKKEKEKFWADIEVLMRAGMPPIVRRSSLHKKFNS